MICCAKLSNYCLEPEKLKEQFRKVHGDRKYWNTTLAEFKIKRARFGENATLPVFGFVLINKSILTASYEVAYLIAKQENYTPLVKNLTSCVKEDEYHIWKAPKIRHHKFLFPMAPLATKLISLKFICSSCKNQRVKL